MANLAWLCIAAMRLMHFYTSNYITLHYKNIIPSATRCVGYKKINPQIVQEKEANMNI